MDKVIRRFQSTISDKKMSLIMFAIIKTHSKLLDTFTINRNNTRELQSGNFVEYLIKIDENKIEDFENIVNVKLEKQEINQDIDIFKRPKHIKDLSNE